MKNTVKGMFAGAAITAALALTAGTAKADPGWVYGDLNDHDGAAFAMTLAHDGDYETPMSAANVAGQVCTARAGGVTEQSLRRQLEVKYSIDLAVDVVDDGEFHFCPFYEVDSRTGGWLWPQYHTSPAPPLSDPSQAT
jgi:hypothetical protein